MVILTRARVCVAAGLVALSAAGAGCTGGTPPDDPTAPPSSAETRVTTSASPTTTGNPSPGEDEQALLDKARADGQVKVLVRLKLPRTPARGAAREQAIADAQDQLQAELEPLGVQIDRRFERIPLVALSANEAALRQLFESNLVDSVDEDAVNRPQS
jgi:hypothetical protein